MVDELRLPANVRIFCNNCRRATNHICKATNSITHYDEDAHFYETTDYRFWICAGCEAGTLEERYTDQNMVDEHGENEYFVLYHPSRKVEHLPGKVFSRLPEKLGRIYKETLGAYNSQLSILCAVGIRALLEGICADKKITGGTLEKKIDKMVSILPENIVRNLHSIRFIGNTAAHDLAAPPALELRLAIEILEDLLNYLYDLDYKAGRLARFLNAQAQVDELFPSSDT